MHNLIFDEEVIEYLNKLPKIIKKRVFDKILLSKKDPNHYFERLARKKEYKMRTKRKVSLTIDEEIYAAIDKASKTLNLAKSQLAQEAFSLWLKKQTETLMAKGYEEMAEEDKAFADVTFEAQREILK